MDMNKLDLSHAKPCFKQESLLKYQQIGLTMEEIVEVTLKLSALEKLGIYMKIEGSGLYCIYGYIFLRECVYIYIWVHVLKGVYIYIYIWVRVRECIYIYGYMFLRECIYIYMGTWGGLYLKPTKFEHIFVAVITFFLFLLCKYF